MSRRGRTTVVLGLLLILQAGCSGQNARAPVASRSTAPEPAPRIVSRGGSSSIPTLRQPAAAATAATVSADVYVVRRGDTLYSIAWQQGMAVQQLAALNRIRPPYTIYAGQRLRLRSAAGVAVSPTSRPAPLAARPLSTPEARPVPAPQDDADVSPVDDNSQVSAGNSPGYDGKWIWPVRGKVLRAYQENGNGKKGIDIAGNMDQPVLAAATGKVVYVGSGLVGYGRLIIIKHNESLLSAYGHNHTLLVAEGDYVTSGQKIATMGSSGTSRAMLYFEIRKDGKPVNPMQFLP